MRDQTIYISFFYDYDELCIEWHNTTDQQLEQLFAQMMGWC